MKTLLVILRKEFRQFFASSFLPKLCVMFPLMVMLVLPLVANMEVKHVGVVIVDNDHSTFSRDLANTISATPNTSTEAVVVTFDQAMRFIEDGTADVIVEIPAGYSISLHSPSPDKINISANSVNATKGMLGMQYVQVIVSQLIARYMPHLTQTDAMSAVQVHSICMFNPTLNYKFFMIPALMIMLVIMLCGFLPALNIVGEKERGTIEQINVSPVNQLTFTFGKVIPYWIIGIVVLSIGIVVAWLVYGLTPRGGVLTLYLSSFLFIIVMSGLAMIFANFSSNMQQVMFVMFFFVVVFILLSGLMTPVQSMPMWAQYITYGLPPRYYVDILRATYLRGAGIVEQWQSFVALAAFAVAILTLAILTYRKRS